MATTLLTAEEMLEETIRKVSSSPDEWLRFLNTASRVYQYSFDDQLMIYAQRPNGKWYKRTRQDDRHFAWLYPKRACRQPVKW